jgi:hypothetical protein
VILKEIAMPLTTLRPDPAPAVGDFYVRRGTGQLVEIMHVADSGDCLVLDATAPLDGEWQHVTAAQIGSSFWQRLASGRHAEAA